MHEPDITKIEAIIYTIRGQRVMVDSDLAQLYGVETKALNRQVQRNALRFPEDFMFKLTTDEFEILKCQIGTSNASWGGRRYPPLVFTEAGVAMLSSVLTSDRAALVNVSIMRTFIKLRSFLAIENSLPEKVSKLEQGTNKMFKVVFERLDNIEDLVSQPHPQRRKIGLTSNKKT
ncbi:MAG: ORF6N domain-containing protein [Bacteriovoracia bacterium]